MNVRTGGRVLKVSDEFIQSMTLIMMLAMTIVEAKLKYTITLKMADQGWSDLHVVFTMILYGANFCIW